MSTQTPPTPIPTRPTPSLLLQLQTAVAAACRVRLFSRATLAPLGKRHVSRDHHGEVPTRTLVPGLQVYNERPSVKKCDCLPTHETQIVHGRKNKACYCCWLKKVNTSWALVGGNIFFAERNHVGIGAVEKNMLLILDIISITQVTDGGITLIPCRSKRRV